MHYLYLYLLDQFDDHHLYKLNRRIYCFFQKKHLMIILIFQHAHYQDELKYFYQNYSLSLEI